MAILLTGGTGFLGSRLLFRLVERGQSVVVLARRGSNLSGIPQRDGQVRVLQLGEGPLGALLDDHEIELVVHCATNYGRSPGTTSDVIAANLVLPLGLLQWAREHGVHGFVNTDTILDRRVNHYALAKAQFGEWLEAFAADLACANVAVEHFYGPGDDPGKFVTRIIRELLLDVERIPLTPGGQQRDFVFIDDVVDALDRVVEYTRSAPRGYHRFEVGTGDNISIREFVELIRRLTGNDRTRLDFGAVPYRPHETMRSHVDRAPLEALGWTPRTSLQQGLELVIHAERRRLQA